MWKINGAFFRLVKCTTSWPPCAVVVLLFSLMASRQIRLRRIDGWQTIATVLRQQTPRAA
jgi:hypothetical protein